MKHLDRLFRKFYSVLKVILFFFFSRTSWRDRRLGDAAGLRPRNFFDRQVSASTDLRRARRQVRALEGGRPTVLRLDRRTDFRRRIGRDVDVDDGGLESHSRVDGSDDLSVDVFSHLEVRGLDGRNVVKLF